MHRSILTAWCRQDTKFNRIERHAGISAADLRQKRKRFFVHLGMVTAKPFFHISNRPCQKSFDIFFGERMEFKDDRAGNQRPVYLKIRIFRRCADQNDRSVLDKRKQIILLPFIEAVNLVNKQNRLFAVHTAVFLRFRDHFFHIFFSGRSRIDLQKFRFCRCRDHFRKCRLSGSRRAIQQDGAQLIRLDGTV